MKDLSDRFNLTQLCSEPTHLNLAGKPDSLLDLVLTNTPEYFHESARPMPPIGSSDHLPVVAKYQSIITKSKPATSSEYTKWLFPLKDVRKMDDAFLYDNWEHVFQPYNDIDETWTRWKLAFLKDLELFIPKSTRKSHNRTPSAPWFSKELKQLIRRKNRLFKKAHASGNSDHWKTYCLERNKTTAAIKRAKSVHFNNQVNTLSDPNCSPSRWWQVARDLCGLKRGVSSCVPPLLDSCGNVISEPVEKANLLNDVFANENTSLNPDASVFGPTNLQLTFNLEKITASEVRRVLRTLPNKSSCGSDRISYQMIKEADPGLVGPLVSLFNASLRLRKVPDEWRKSIIKPIFKGGRKDRRDPSSYRPIALTSCVARTMEKVLNARILEYLQKNSLLYEHQSGFQRNHSTISQLCFLAHQLTTALDGGKNVQSVFLDLSKAYDRVSIPGLLSKLSLIGFSSSATEWFASFLTHREQCVLLDGTTSAPLTPKSGIPQGTVLDQCSSWFLLTIFPSPPRANVRSLLMIQHCTLLISPTYQAVHVLVLISTQQPHGLKDGACSLAPPRASISQLEGQRNRAHLCEWTGSPSPRSGHINTLGWYLTTHWHGMTTFPMYTARARGCWESCGVLMVTFPRRAWKESTKLQFDPVWNTHALCGVEDPQGPFNACKILSPNDSDWRSLHWRIDLTITPSSYFTKYVKT